MQSARGAKINLPPKQRAPRVQCCLWLDEKQPPHSIYDLRGRGDLGQQG